MDSLNENMIGEPQKSILRKCVITRYDETIKEPPYLTIPVDKVEVRQPIVDEGGGNILGKALFGLSWAGVLSKILHNE